MSVYAATSLHLFLAATAFFFTIATLAHVTYFVWLRKRCHPDDQRPTSVVWREVAWSLAGLAGNALFMAPLHILVVSGHSRVYSDLSEYGLGYALGSIVAVFLLTETCVYWIHRALHSNALWFLHKPHHSFKVASPYTGSAFNPVDSFMQALPHHLCVFIIPMHENVYAVWLAALVVWSVSIHTRVYLVRHPAINSGSHHTLHHWYSDYNFGQYTTFWDRLCGTYRSPESAYTEIPAWVHPRGTIMTPPSPTPTTQVFAPTANDCPANTHGSPLTLTNDKLAS